jgi:hypothetical protein
MAGNFELRRRAELEILEYYERLKTAVDGLERNEVEQRQAVYLNARNALISELRATSPPLAPADIARRRLKLEQAIRVIERESAASAAPAQIAAPSESIDDGGYNTGSVLEMASTPAEIEPAPEDVFRRAIEAAKNCGRIETSVAATPPSDEAVRVQLDEDSSVTAGPAQLRIDDEHEVRAQLLLGPSRLRADGKDGSRPAGAENIAEKKRTRLCRCGGSHPSGPKSTTPDAFVGRLDHRACAWCRRARLVAKGDQGADHHHSAWQKGWRHLVFRP